MVAWPLLDSSLIAQGGAVLSPSGMTTVTASATVHTKGPWTELVASCPETSLLNIRFLQASPATTDTAVLIDIGIGPAGSEVVVVPNMHTGGWNGIPGVILPLAIPAGTRIAARIQSAVASKTIEMQVHCGGGGVVPADAVGDAITYGADTAASAGTTLTTVGSANVKGAWTELVAATTRDHRFIVPFPGKPAGTTVPATNGLIDIGIGPAGSEVVLVPDLYYETYTSEVMTPNNPLLPCRIPAGTRLSARYQSTGTTAAGAPRVAVTLF